MNIFISQCLRCKKFIDDTNFTCKVYPGGIPDSLVFNKRKCSKRKEQDNDKKEIKMEGRRQGKSQIRQ